ncbi:putative surface protein with fasciclin (FAS1) repeats [Luteimonas cucumeris]|uniref:Putative surface protein with fasciclin (FAS1) repeats n=1 Tax=Luteimonas cucumeris TaxID=985012 RepID=A0A562L7Y0_9GAMM|nr:fasciclin domain-containing protein [Luteimonas cucumeris]TWI03782.1 putative surface protein with fasciclin (FAS1) repeats [Luteimonas cucumeris]
MNNSHNSTTGTNVLDTAAANGTFKTFGKAVEQAGLSETLRGPGPFTIFAPTDSAFDKLPAGKLENLMKPENKAELVSILNYHVVSGRKSAADVGKWEAARTINGQSAPIKLVDNKVVIDGAQVTTADIGSSNGVIHGIDKVNLPSATELKQ